MAHADTSIKTIAVDIETYRWLIRLAAKLQAESGTSISIPATLRHLRTEHEQADADAS